MDQLIIFTATFILVFFRGLQQQNVIHGHYIAAALMPYLIACGEVTSVLFVVDVGFSAIPYVGTGGATGIVLSMYLHRSWRAKNERRPIKQD